MSERSFDLVVYGATGFTGQQAARYLAARPEAGNLRWAIGGRNRDKLEAVRSSLGSAAENVGVVVADAGDADAVNAMVADTKAIATTAGPFALYGDHVVAACVKHRTSYADITGETPWVRKLVDRHHDAAARDGTRIVPFCGIDSVPSDIGTLALVDHFRERHGQACRWVKAFFTFRGGFNGGTLASAINMFESGELAALNDPLLLNPAEQQSDAERDWNPDQRDAVFDPDLKAWTAPFMMAPVNTRVVRRSAALCRDWGQPYGSSFRYAEAMHLGASAGKLSSSMVAGVLRTFERVGGTDRGRRFLRRLGPKPGEGPSEKTLERGFFKTVLIGEAEDGRRARCTMSDRGDPGNRVTVKMLIESALALVLDEASLPGQGRGGILTPATGLGLPLARRLSNAGVKIIVEE